MIKSLKIKKLVEKIEVLHSSLLSLSLAMSVISIRTIGPLNYLFWYRYCFFAALSITSSTSVDNHDHLFIYSLNIIQQLPELKILANLYLKLLEFVLVYIFLDLGTTLIRYSIYMYIIYILKRNFHPWLLLCQVKF